MEKVMDRANINNRKPLNFANHSVLKPIINPMAKTISAIVAMVPIIGIMDSGNQGFSIPVYSKKFSQFPQVETSLLHHPNRSATADKNPAERASLRNNLINLLSMQVFLSRTN